MKEFIALKPTMYSYMCTGSNHSHITLKGVPACDSIDITLEQYREWLYNGELHRVTTNRLQFLNQDMSMVTTNNLALSPFEDKRYYLNNNISAGYGRPLSLRQNMNNGKKKFHT